MRDGAPSRGGQAGCPLFIKYIIGHGELRPANGTPLRGGRTMNWDFVNKLLAINLQKFWEFGELLKAVLGDKDIVFKADAAFFFVIEAGFDGDDETFFKD